MLSTRIRTYMRQNVLGLVAIFIALGGTAYATHPGGPNTINSGDIIDGEVKEADVGQGAVASPEIKNDSIVGGDLAPDSIRTGKIADGEVTAADVATGGVRTDEIANGQVEAQDLAPGVAPGASGARAWGLVDRDGNLLRSKNVSGVTHPIGGAYCIDPGSGIDPTTAVMVVGEDLTHNDTGFFGPSHVEWRSSTAQCPAGTMEVATFLGNGTPPSEGEVDIGGFSLTSADQGFSFVIP